MPVNKLQQWTTKLDFFYKLLLSKNSFLFILAHIRPLSSNNKEVLPRKNATVSERDERNILGATSPKTLPICLSRVSPWRRSSLCFKAVIYYNKAIYEVVSYGLNPPTFKHPKLSFIILTALTCVRFKKKKKRFCNTKAAWTSPVALLQT